MVLSQMLSSPLKANSIINQLTSLLQVINNSQKMILFNISPIQRFQETLVLKVNTPQVHRSKSPLLQISHTQKILLPPKGNLFRQLRTNAINQEKWRRDLMWLERARSKEQQRLEPLIRRLQERIQSSTKISWKSCKAKFSRRLKLVAQWDLNWSRQWILIMLKGPLKPILRINLAHIKWVLANRSPPSRGATPEEAILKVISMMILWPNWQDSLGSKQWVKWIRKSIETKTTPDTHRTLNHVTF